VTNRLTDNGNLGGIGVTLGYDFPLSGMSGITFGPVVSFNGYFDQTINRNFPGGAFIGTQRNWSADIGGKLGYWATPMVQLYVLGGLHIEDFALRSNFTGPVLSENHTATGWFVGGGLEYTKKDWTLGNGRVSVYGQVTYSEFCGDTFYRPAFSPAFDYRVASSQFGGMLGVNWRPFAPPPPPSLPPPPPPP
jgi:opacity protein-like surface antigen